MSALKEILAKFTFSVDDSGLKKAGKGVKDTEKKIKDAGVTTDSFAKKVVTAFAASEIIGGIRGFIGEMFALEGQISDTSDALGISRQAYQEWSYVASRGGASAEDVATAFKILQKNAADGSTAFSELGVKAKDANGNVKDSSVLMGEVATALSSVSDPAKRTKLALEILGKGGSKLNAIFSKGPEAIAELRKRFAELGGGVSEEALDAIGSAADAVDDVDLSTKHLKGSIMLLLGPAIKSAANWFAKFSAELSKGDAASTRLKSALITLGVAGAAAGLAMLAPYLPFLATMAALYLIVEDFYGFMQGADSVTGAVIEWLFGKGSADKVREDLKGLRKDWDEFRKDADRHTTGGKAGPFDLIKEGFSKAGADMVKFLVEDLPLAAKTAAEQMVTTLMKPFAPEGYQASFDGIGIRLISAIGNALNPMTLIAKATAIGVRIAQAIGDGIRSAAANIIQAITFPIGSVNIPGLRPSGDRGGDGPGWGDVLKEIPKAVIPGAQFLFGANAPSRGGSYDVRRQNNTRIEIHGAPNARELARQIDPIVRDALADDVDGLGVDVAGVA